VDYIRLNGLKRVLRPPKDATKIILYYYARAYIMHMFRVMIFTGLTGNAVTFYFLSMLENFVAIGNYSWGSEMLAYMYR